MTQIVSATTGGAGVQVSLALNEDLIVDAGVQLYAESQSAVSALGGGTILVAAGASVTSLSDFGFHAAILQTDADADEVTLRVADTATVLGRHDGVSLAAEDSAVFNGGAIIADATAVTLGRRSFLSNEGEIAGDGSGVDIGDGATIVNGGSITARGGAINAQGNLFA
ncbi:MAG: hypothetical protein AAFZ09_21155, partial [Pseudomonadota bacterium]